MLAPALRTRYEVTYLVDESFRGMTKNFPGITHEVVRPRSFLGRVKLAARIRKKYDIVLDLAGTPAAAVLARVASRGSVVGYSGKRLSRLYDRRVPSGGPDDHTVEINLGFLDALGIERPVNPAIVLENRHAARRGAILHPGGRFAHKLWPAERFAEVARHLSQNTIDVTILVGPGESCPQPLRGFSLLTRVPAAELGGALTKFELFIGNDSGPMHLAAAAGCRVIGIFGPSNPARWRPWSENARVVTAPCRCGFGTQEPCRYPSEWCLEKITVAKVIESI